MKAWSKENTMMTKSKLMDLAHEAARLYVSMGGYESGYGVCYEGEYASSMAYEEGCVMFARVEGDMDRAHSEAIQEDGDLAYLAWQQSNYEIDRAHAEAIVAEYGCDGW